MAKKSKKTCEKGMARLLQGVVEHSVKVTRIPGVGFGVRVFVNGTLNQEDIALTRMEIGHVARSMLRMEDKCGNISNFAHSARMRPVMKVLARKTVADKA
jgi:hypothetical protein